MPEQDYVTIPPGVTSQIAADDPSGTGIGPFAQQMSITNLAASIKSLMQQLSILGMAQDTSTGRLRVLLDLVTGGVTLPNLTQINGFGPVNSTVTAAHYMPLDILTDAWANSVRRNVT